MDLRHPQEGARVKGRARDRREAEESVKTPCIKVCVMDLDSGRCRGCCRTLEEIGRWGTMSDEERNRIMAELPGRKASDVAKVAVPPLS
jgi:predicted Fe-S protein YdhL (DUF1289 family)